MKIPKIFLLMLFVLLVSLNCAKKDDESNLTASDVNAPSTPSGLAAQETNGFINLTWTKSPESDVAKYRLYRSNSTISNLPDKNLSPVQKLSFKEQGYIEETGIFYADTDITVGNTYFYRVSAVDQNNNESRKSNQVTITYGDHAAPAKPTGITALAGSKKGEIYLSWTASSEGDFLCYNIYGSSQGGGDFIFLSSQSVNNYTATGLIPGNGYFFKVSTIDNSNNESDRSDAVFCKAKGDSISPAIPSGLSALQGSSAGVINLSWSPNTEADLTKYRIYQSATGSSYSTIDEVIGQPPDTTYVVKGLTSSSNYYFKISALDDSDNESNLSTRAWVVAP